MTTPAATAFASLKAQLATIAAGSGYRTTVGIVASRHDELDLGGNAPLPALLLQPINDTPVESNGPVEEIGTWQKSQTWDRKIRLEGFVSGEGDYESALDDLLHDVRVALTQYGINPLYSDGPTFTPPNLGANEGGDVASFSLTLRYRYRFKHID